MIPRWRVNAHLALAACGALAAGLVAAPSDAAELTTDDGEGDVWQAVYGDDDTLEGWVEAGSIVNGDVISTTARHKARRIVFVTRYASLVSGEGEDSFITSQRMRFADGSTASVHVYTSHTWEGESYLADDDTGNGMKCEGIWHKINYDTDTVKVSFPRRCVDRPAWMRYVGLAWTLGGSGTVTQEDDFNYLDNARSPGHKQGNGDRNTSRRIYPDVAASAGVSGSQRSRSPG